MMLSALSRGNNYFYKKILSGDLISVSCLILAILFKITLTYYFLQFDTDKIYQASAAKNLIEGHGLTIKQVHVNDLSQDKYEPLSGWPPGYSLLVALFYKFFKDLELSCFAIDALAIVLFFIVLKKLLKEFELPAYVINLLLLFNGLMITDSIILGAPTDLLALACCLWSCFIAVQVFKNNNNSIILAIFLGLLNVLPALFRYMYIPSTFVIPCFLIYAGTRDNTSLLRSGMIILSLAIISLATLLIFQYSYTGNAVYIIPTEQGIFWSNLFFLHPVLFSSFINLDFLSMQLSLHTGISYITWTTVFEIINIPLLLFLIFHFLKYCTKVKLSTNSSWNVFSLITGLTCLCILTVLGYISLTNSRHRPPPNLQTWTYISDGRYFIGMRVFLLIVVARWLFVIRKNWLTTGKKMLQYLFIFVLAVDILHGVYFLAKNFTLDRRNNKAEVLQQQLLNFLRTAIRENKVHNRDVIVSNNTYLMNRSVLLGEKGLFNRKELNSSRIYSSRPALLIVPMEDFQFSFYQPFLSKKGVQLQTKIGRYYIYYYYIVPDDRN